MKEKITEKTNVSSTLKWYYPHLNEADFSVFFTLKRLMSLYISVLKSGRELRTAVECFALLFPLDNATTSLQRSTVLMEDCPSLAGNLLHR